MPHGQETKTKQKHHCNRLNDYKKSTSTTTTKIFLTKKPLLKVKSESDAQGNLLSVFHLNNPIPRIEAEFLEKSTT